MNISEAAKQSGVSAKMIRHYEAIGLLPKSKRTISNYRRYEANDVHVIRFIRRARDLGFSTRDIKALLGVWRNQRRSSAAVKKLVQEHILVLDEKIRQLKSIADTLTHLARHCHGDDRPDCPILEDLAENRKPVA